MISPEDSETGARYPMLRLVGPRDRLFDPLCIGETKIGAAFYDSVSQQTCGARVAGSNRRMLSGMCLSIWNILNTTVQVFLESKLQVAEEYTKQALKHPKALLRASFFSSAKI